MIRHLYKFYLCIYTPEGLFCNLKKKLLKPFIIVILMQIVGDAIKSDAVQIWDYTIVKIVL